MLTPPIQIADSQADKPRTKRLTKEKGVRKAGGGDHEWPPPIRRQLLERLPVGAGVAKRQCQDGCNLGVWLVAELPFVDIGPFADPWVFETGRYGLIGA